MYEYLILPINSAATSVAAQDATFEHNFGMFSVPTTSEVSLRQFNIVLHHFWTVYRC